MANIETSAYSTKILTLSGEEALRPLAVGTNWTELRVALSMNFSDPGASITGAGLAVGLTASPLAGYKSASGEHFVGLVDTDATWTRVAGAQKYLTATGLQAATKVNGSLVTYSGTAAPYWLCDPTWGARNCFILNVKKGATWEVGFAGNGANSDSATYDMPWTEIERAVPCATVSAMQSSLSGNYLSRTWTSIAVNEATNGYLNTVAIYWPTTTPACSLRVERLMVYKYT